ncbi:Acetylornithine aminotransferase [uncultured Blautia sp.]
MTMIEKMNQAEEYVLHTYNRFPVVFEKGEGVCLYDTEGKEYLDFAAGIAVNALGYHYPGYDEALKAQIDKLLHVSNLYYNVPIAEAGEKLVKASGLEKVFFTNSGTEAIEGALKAAKKYAYIRDGHSGHEIIAMNHSFHGRTIGALSVTGNAHYRDPFAPLMDGVKFADFNDINSVKEKITEKTCAILLEPVQGEGGIFPAEQDFLDELRKICDEKDILLIFDEIQCGMGRTGNYFAWQAYGIKPDIMTCAKALGCGVPVGAFVLGKKAAKASLAPGDHGTTYGGNPFVCAAVSRVFDIFEKDEILKHVQEHILFLEDALDRLAANHDCVLERRGMGFMQGLVLKKEYPVGEVVKKALDEGLLVISAGENVLRIVPPLIIRKEDILKMEEILNKCFVYDGL